MLWCVFIVIKFILIGIICYFLLIPVVFGIIKFFGGIKYVYKQSQKDELLKRHLALIKDGYIIQGFPHYGWSVSYYPSTDRTWFYPKIYDFFYKWSVYYRFKWCNRC